MRSAVTVISYYSPEELTGIGKYNGEMIQWLLDEGLKIYHYSNAPFYPAWSLYKGAKNHVYKKRKSGNLVDIRSWVYIPKKPTAIKKILSEITFFLSSSVALLLNLRLLKKSNAVLVILPPFFLNSFVICLKQIFKFKLHLHIQDLQVDAANELRLLPQWLNPILGHLEKIMLTNADSLSTISRGMQLKIENKGIGEPIFQVPNWSDIQTIRPIDNCKWLHDRLGLARDARLIVYSGNIGEKQGLEIVLECAKILESTDFKFVLLGDGLFKRQLIELSDTKYNNSNVIFSGLVPTKNLPEMLNSSFIQLVIQKSVGADSFLPSKLTNILSAGVPSIVTAEQGTSLHDLLWEAKTAMVIPPDNADFLSKAIVKLAGDTELAKSIRMNARTWAEKNLTIDRCLNPLLHILAQDIDD